MMRRKRKRKAGTRTIDFGIIVRMRRQEKHLSQEKLANIAYCSRQTLCDLEHGRIPNISILSSVLNALDLKLDVVELEHE